MAESTIDSPDAVERNVEEYVRLTREEADIKARIDSLKGWFEAQGVKDLDATKVKMVSYWGDNGKVEVGRNETISGIALTVLRQIFGPAYTELIRPKESLDMTADCKKLLAPIYLGNYIETPLDDIIAAATGNDKAQAALRKKLRGNFKTDKKALMRIAELAEKDAEYYAYMADEACAYSRFVQLLHAAGWSGTVQEAVDVVRSAVVVTEGVKVTLDMPKDGD